MKLTALSAAASCIFLSLAQPTSDSVLSDRPNGMKHADSTHHVFINATVHPEPGVVWEHAMVEIRDGWIVGVGPMTEVGIPIVPTDATVHDLEGEHIYAAFIDPYIEVDAPKRDSDAPGSHWNSGVTPQRSALDGIGLDADAAKARRKMGFGAAVIVPGGGVFAGSASAVSLAEKPSDESLVRTDVYMDNVFQALDFQASGWTVRTYPTSTPGAVALIRQTLIDADWQALKSPTLDGSNPRNALSPLEDASVPLVFALDHELEHFLVDDIATEMSRPAVVVGNGMEFKWLDGIAEIGRPIILPLRFPAEPDVSSVGKAEAVELETMMAWEQAPTNPRRLIKKMDGVDIALTSSRLPKGREFHKELRSAIERGLKADDALAMLTTAPASIAGLSDQLGTLEAGKRANLLITSGPLFELETDDSVLRDIWIDGVRHRLNDRPGPSFDGDWKLWIGDEAEPVFEMRLQITGSPKKTKIIASETWGKDLPDGEQDEAQPSDARKINITGARISFLLDDDDDEQVTYIMSGVLVDDDRVIGTGVATDDSKFGWTAKKTDSAKADPEDAKGDSEDKPAEIKQTPPLPGYPFGPYARRYEPDAETLLLTNATIWTSTDRGKFDTGWMFISGGRIIRVEPGPAPKWMLDGSNEEIVVLDASGKHITPGLVDAHSHTSLFRFGVNEAAQAVTSEVRIGDSLDPSSINWYRQLAMGVTTVNSLHGSANPIGGQNELHKIRWGVKKPSDMRVVGARPGIKFALGENVKQSNWNIEASKRTRYPQTRLGVEALIRDRFEAAREYTQKQERLGIDNVRRDLELEPLAQILAGNRLIHSHSYRQDEILMLCRIADDFGFQIGSFQHGLEVYKVAEKVREHALGASIFSDWWMYKTEVMDAIPFAGPLQTEAGVMTSYNSDSDELARRLNTEAAKAVKYARPGSGMTEAEALKFVTSNPAKQIGAGATGRLEEAIDADFVIWTDNPLSTRARAERVFIDGREYYSIEQDRIARINIAKERQRLIQKIIALPKSDKKAGDDEGAESESDALAFERTNGDRRGVMPDWFGQGFHPDDMRPGDHGCGIINHRIYYENMDTSGNN